MSLVHQARTDIGMEAHCRWLRIGVPDRFLAGRKGKDLPTSETDLHKSEADGYFSLLARLPDFIAYGAAEPIGRATATGAPTADVFLDDKAT